MLDHLAIQCGDVQASAKFYDAVLEPLGGRRLLDFGTVIGYGVAPKPDFFIGECDSGEGFRESHIAFAAADRATVRRFFDVAVAAGAEVLHEPRVWPEYHEHYYGAFVRDPDGNNVEAVCHARTLVIDRGGHLGGGTNDELGSEAPGADTGSDQSALVVVDVTQNKPVTVTAGGTKTVNVNIRCPSGITVIGSSS